MLGLLKARFMFTSSNDENEDYASFLIKHGDNVKDVAFKVNDLNSTLQCILKNGGYLLSDARTLSDKFGSVEIATVATAQSDMRHTLIEAHNYKGIFLPGFCAYKNNFLAEKL
ncbi:unnamed protein product [Anisakis simplex]|uniref:4-hydroxyphenylpyruvate dioxygenase n=1 Tax=Anisakis simplex TaxID=6269 RepID=A0A0M3J757_ANISI|nr:unnamed protein product [Anisakis simplex]